MKLFALTVLLASLAGTALAQPEARDVAVARREFQAGVQAARAGDWPTARDHFARSYEINPRVSALFNLAGAQTQTGELVASAESYREYLGRRDEAPSGNVAEAERLLAGLERRIPTLRLTIENLQPDDQIFLDTDALNRLLLDDAVPIDPGDHAVVIRRNGDDVATERFTAGEGAQLAITVTAPPPAAEPAPLPEVTDPSPSPEPDTGPDLSPSAAASTVPPEDDSGSVVEQWWFWTIIGVVVVTGVVIGVVAATSTTEAPNSRGFQSIAPVEVP